MSRRRLQQRAALIAKWHLEARERTPIETVVVDCPEFKTAACGVLWFEVDDAFAHHFGIDLDAAIDKMNRRGLETDMTEHAVYEVYGSWSENAMSWTRKPHRAIYVMRYEDMLQRPLETFGCLCRHLLLDPSDAQLTRAIDLSSFEQAKAQEAQKGHRERPDRSKAFFRAGHAGQWRQKLSQQQISRIVTGARANGAL